MDVALLQYILAQQKQGIPPEEITKMLTEQGWPPEAIEEGFKYIAAHPNQIENHNEIFSRKLRGSMDLLLDARKLITNNLWNIVFISFAPTAVIICIVVGLFILSNVLKIANINNISSPFSIIFAIAAIIITLFYIWIYLWCETAIYVIISTRGAKINWREAMRRSLSIIAQFWWILILQGCIVMSGYLLLLIPGILFSIWFLFAPFVYLLENEKGMNALLKSREYVRGISISILWKIVFIIQIVVVKSLLFFILKRMVPDPGLKVVIDIVSISVDLLITPLIIAYWYLLFENVRAVKGAVSIKPSGNSKAFYIGFGLIGILLFASLLVGGILLVGKYKMKPTITPKQMAILHDTASIKTSLRLYYADKGLYPENLQKLSPDYLPSSYIDSSQDWSYDYKPAVDRKSFVLCAMAKSSIPYCVNSEN